MHNQMFDNVEDFVKFFKENDRKENRKAVLQTDRLKALYFERVAFNEEVLYSIKDDKRCALVIIRCKQRMPKGKFCHFAHKRFVETKGKSWAGTVRHILMKVLNGEVYITHDDYEYISYSDGTSSRKMLTCPREHHPKKA